MTAGRVVGQTKDAGFEIGVSKTIPYAINRVWNLLTSAEGLAVWLGPGARLDLRKGSTYQTADGTTGEVRSIHEHDRIRLTWRPSDWSHDTTVQVAIRASGDKTLLRVHQEWLADADERTRQRTHWQNVLGALIERLESDAGR
ncbi:MAG TPA: SRPBCC domain-containing protein [Kribbella sp.]|nr:SRPBCC domain-containing protein [Kribbella sp.]